MTATQVFLRFIQSNYTNSDGTVDRRALRIWRKELRLNSISSKPKHPFSYQQIRTKYSREISSKNYVDDYLIKNRRSLNGFLAHFLTYRAQWSLLYNYGSTQTEGMKQLIKRWKDFLKNHLNEEHQLKKFWGKDKVYTFTWRD